MATHDAETGALTVFAVNRLLTDDIAIDIDARAFGTLRLAGATQLSNPDPYLKVTADTAGSVSPVANGNAGWNDGSLTVVAPPLSWNVIRFAAGSPPRS